MSPTARDTIRDLAIARSHRRRVRLLRVAGRSAMSLSEQDRADLVRVLVGAKQDRDHRFWHAAISAIEPELDALIARHVAAAKADAYDEGLRAACPDPDRCWCEDFIHTPGRPHTPNPYRTHRPT